MDRTSKKTSLGHLDRRSFLKASVATGAVASLGLSAPAIAQDVTMLRYGSPLPEGSVYHKAITMFADEVKKLSDGKMAVDTFPASQLGGIREMLTSVQDGSLDFTLAVPAWYSNFVRPMDVFTLPYLVDSTEKLQNALQGELGTKVSGIAEGFGFHYVGYYLMGGRHIVNKVHPVTDPAGVKGLKLRVINSPIYVAAFQALGANTVAMDPSELYLALQQGVVDGFEYPLPDLLDFKMYEVAKYLTLDRHTTDFFVISTNKAKWDKLSSEQQGIVEQAMKTSSDWQWQEQPKSIASALVELRTKMEVADISPEMRDEFIAITRPIYPQFEEVIGPDLMNMALKQLG